MRNDMRQLYSRKKQHRGLRQKKAGSHPSSSIPLTLFFFVSLPSFSPSHRYRSALSPLLSYISPSHTYSIPHHCSIFTLSNAVASEDSAGVSGIVRQPFSRNLNTESENGERGELFTMLLFNASDFMDVKFFRPGYFYSCRKYVQGTISC